MILLQFRLLEEEQTRSQTMAYTSHFPVDIMYNIYFTMYNIVRAIYLNLDGGRLWCLANSTLSQICPVKYMCGNLIYGFLMKPSVQLNGTYHTV